MFFVKSIVRIQVIHNIRRFIKPPLHNSIRNYQIYSFVARTVFMKDATLGARSVEVELSNEHKNTKHENVET